MVYISLICTYPRCRQSYSIPLHVHRARQLRSTRNYCSPQCANKDRSRHHPRGTVEERFWSKVAKAGADDCWLWKSGVSSSGYGSFAILDEDGKRLCASAHVASWFLAHGTFPPKGQWVLHNCPFGRDDRRCVNPRHLWLGTHKDNMADCIRKGRNNAVTHPESFAKGERHGLHKLTDTQWEEILVLLQEDTLSRRQIAAQYGIYPGAIASRLKIRGLSFSTKTGRRKASLP